MNIFSRVWTAVQFFFKLFGADAAAAQRVVESNSPIIKAAKPVVADIARLVPDTKVALHVAQSQVRSILIPHLGVAQVDEWLEENFHLSVKDLLRAAALRLIRMLPIAKDFSDHSINLAIEFALGLIRV
jgi:hypothetical protein